MRFLALVVRSYTRFVSKRPLMYLQISAYFLALYIATTLISGTHFPLSNPGQSAVDTTVCNVIAHPRNFNDQRIRVLAEILHDGIHGGVVSDPTCKLGFELWFAKSAKGNSDMVALDQAIFREGCIGTAWKQIHATVSGRFQWHPRKKRGKYVLELDRVENLDVQRESGHCDNLQSSPR